MVYRVVIIFYLLYQPCLSADSQDLAPWLNELSEQNYLNLVNVSDKSYNQTLSKAYYHIDPKEILRQNNKAEEKDPTEEKRDLYTKMEYVNPGFEHIDKACYTIQTTWRRARLDFHRYFSLREHYENTHYFEIGYLTHVIVSKYMNILELYEMVNYRFVKHATKKYAPTSWVWFMYTNILEYSRAIIHWCNMMAEVKKKYGLESGTSKDGPDYETLTTPDPEDMELDKFLKNLHKNYQAELVAKKKKQMESRLHYKYGMRNPSMNLTTSRTKRPPQFWKWRTGTAGFNKDYGWSKEEFF